MTPPKDRLYTAEAAKRAGISKATEGGESSRGGAGHPWLAGVYRGGGGTNQGVR